METIDFILLEFVVEVHDFFIEEYGGLPGIRDDGLLLASLNRAKFYHHYELYTISQLAAVYIFSINDGHVFVDGNKRTSLAVAETFLDLNGYRLAADNESLEKIALDVAKGKISLEELCLIMDGIVVRKFNNLNCNSV